MDDEPIPLKNPRGSLAAIGLSLLLHGVAAAAAITITLGHDEAEAPETVAVELTAEPPTEPAVSSPSPSPEQRQATPPPAAQPHKMVKPAKHLERSQRQNAETPRETPPEAAPLPTGEKIAALAVARPGPSDGGAASGGDAETTLPAAYRLGQPETPAPTYPLSARRKGHEGTVVLRLAVTSDGAAADVQVIKSSGHPILDDAATETLKTWHLRPARQHGMPVAASIDVPIRFVLE
ncbi:energy transducer TonB [Telmatospirillum sp.]|uniref:energy transducer TonB n=1 Tax=Telmatospirillum sp. TaxID=2079197 RepID=UPI002850B848|nr:energy transducer TonB [Telmatospirillum sp.]MDR3435632.1 energy transducer TonB [Telmatospirillum sp.]